MGLPFGVLGNRDSELIPVGQGREKSFGAIDHLRLSEIQGVEGTRNHGFRNDHLRNHAPSSLDGFRYLPLRRDLDPRRNQSFREESVLRSTQLQRSTTVRCLKTESQSDKL